MAWADFIIVNILNQTLSDSEYVMIDLICINLEFVKFWLKCEKKILDWDERKQMVLL